MELVPIYQCLCDRTRLRILNLLDSGPLCVCHFQTLLKEGQVKISKHLAYLGHAVWSKRSAKAIGSSIGSPPIVLANSMPTCGASRTACASIRSSGRISDAFGAARLNSPG